MQKNSFHMNYISENFQIIFASSNHRLTQTDSYKNYWYHWYLNEIPLVWRDDIWIKQMETIAKANRKPLPYYLNGNIWYGSHLHKIAKYNPRSRCPRLIYLDLSSFHIVKERIPEISYLWYWYLWYPSVVQRDAQFHAGVGNTLNCINSSLFKDFIFQQKPHSISIWWFRDFKWDAVILLFTSPSLDVDCIYLDSWTKFNFIELGAVTTMVVEKAPKSFTVPKNRWRLKVYFWEWYRHKLWQAFYTLR